MEGGPARWRKVSDAVAGFLRADGKLAPIYAAFKSNDFILCQMYREGALTLDEVRQLRRDDRKLTYTRQQADKSIICRKEVVTKDQFIDLIQDATVQILF